MKRIKTAIVAGITFQGETVADAKAKGEKSIHSLVTEAHGIGPAYYRVGNLMALIWPVVDGWEWRIIEPGDLGGNARASCNQGGTRADAVADAVFAAVQRLWTHDCEDASHIRDGFRALLESREPHLIAVANRRVDEMTSWCAWQRRCKAARDHGADANQAHDIACRTNSIADAISLARDAVRQSRRDAA